MKVAIAIPTLDMVATDFAMSLASMLAVRAYDKKLSRTIDLALMHQTGSLIMEARNALVERAIDCGASHILFLDSDMTFPPDTLSRLASHHKDIAAATYVKRMEPPTLLGEPILEGTLFADGLRLYRSIPLGCALIKLSVFSRIQRPFFRYMTLPEGTISEDTYFCLQAEAANIPIHVDTRLTAEVGHVGVKVYRP